MSTGDLSKQGKLELVLDLNGELLEGPIWDDRIQKLHFIDINKQLIHTFDPHTDSTATRSAIYCCWHEFPHQGTFAMN